MRPQTMRILQQVPLAVADVVTLVALAAHGAALEVGKELALEEAAHAKHGSEGGQLEKRDRHGAQ